MRNGVEPGESGTRPSRPLATKPSGCDRSSAEVRGIRRKLERETVTQRGLDEDLARADAVLGQLPGSEPEPAHATGSDGPINWRIGMRARTRTGGAEGRIAALERGGRRATLEAGGMRITVAVEDLEPAVGGDDASRSAGGSKVRGVAASSSSLSGSASRLQFDRARTVASSLDLRGAKVQEALEVLDPLPRRWRPLAGLDQATIIHGLGTGALRDAVRDQLTTHALVKFLGPGERGEGGDGATIRQLLIGRSGGVWGGRPTGPRRGMRQRPRGWSARSRPPFIGGVTELGEPEWAGWTSPGLFELSTRPTRSPRRGTTCGPEPDGRRLPVARLG